MSKPENDRRLPVKLLWFAGLWGAGVLALAAVAVVIRWLL